MAGQSPFTTKLNEPSYEEYRDLILKTPEFADKIDTTNYDMMTAYYDLGYDQMMEYSLHEDKHLPDTYKKPNHPTFSTESIYSTKDNPGGTWTKKDDKWEFTPSKANIDNVGDINKYVNWFTTNEPNAILKLDSVINK